MHLMNCPLHFHISRSIRLWKFHSLNDMRQLKYQTENKPLRNMHGQKTYKKLPPCYVHYNQGHYDEKGIIYDFENEQFVVFDTRVVNVLADLTFLLEHLLEIFTKDPRQGGKHIQQEGIVMLVFHGRCPFLIRR